MENEGFLFERKSVGLFGIGIENYLPEEWKIFKSGILKNTTIFYIVDENSMIRYQATYHKKNSFGSDPVTGEKGFRTDFSAELIRKDGPKIQDHSLYLRSEKITEYE